MKQEFIVATFDGSLAREVKASFLISGQGAIPQFHARASLTGIHFPLSNLQREAGQLRRLCNKPSSRCLCLARGCERLERETGVRSPHANSLINLGKDNTKPQSHSERNDRRFQLLEQSARCPRGTMHCSLTPSGFNPIRQRQTSKAGRRRSMNSEYQNYLTSEAWKHKREQRLSIAKHRCAACGSSDFIQVHHLTYARIFNEDMADLLPLCQPHHEAAELLVKRGLLPRGDNVLFLAAETVRLVSVHNIKPKSKPKGFSVETRNPNQKWLLEQDWFNAALEIKSRKKFKRLCRDKLEGEPYFSSKMANCFVLRFRLTNQR